MNNETTPTATPTKLEINLNQLGGIRGSGLFLTFIVVAFIVYCTIWFYRNYNSRIVKAHQPIFLITIVIGLLLWTLSVIPASIDDAVASVDGCTIACNARLWMAEMGFTTSFAALFSKLMRVNKLFHNPQFRRIKVEPKDVLAPFLIVASVNFGLLLTLSLADPLKWVREPISNDPTDTFGHCKEMGKVANICVAFINIFNLFALIITVYQACRARNISEEFSESKYLAIGLYNWLQLSIISIPILILVEEGDPSTKYFVEVSMALAQVMSMMLALFVPMILKQRQMEREGNNRGEVRITGIATSVATAGTAQASNGTTSAGTAENHARALIHPRQAPDSTRAKLGALEEAVADLEKANQDFQQKNKTLVGRLEVTQEGEQDAGKESINGNEEKESSKTDG